MATNALSIDGSCWLLILSFATRITFEAFKYSRINKQFFREFLKILYGRGNPNLWDFSRFLAYTPDQSFWMGFQYHYPFWNVELKNTREMFTSHILESLKRSTIYEARTDQVLCFLIKTDAFKVQKVLHKKRKKYLASLCYFIIDNLANPLLYIYLKARRGEIILPKSAYSLAQWAVMHYHVDFSNSKWIRDQFEARYRYIKHMIRNYSSGRLKMRFRRLLSIHNDPVLYFDNAFKPLRTRILSWFLALESVHHCLEHVFMLQNLELIDLIDDSVILVGLMAIPLLIFLISLRLLPDRTVLRLAYLHERFQFYLEKILDDHNIFNAKIKCL